MSGNASPARRILHVDCDCYFVQVARLEDPEGAGRARLLVVGGSPESRGVVTSADYAVRAYGVRSGMPMAQALRLCPEATVVPVPRAACSARSREIRRVLERFAPVVEAASIDEFYLDLSGTEALYRNEPLEATAKRIQRAVLEETRITVSIGGAAARMVAKLATGEAKPAGVRIVAAGEEAAFLRGFALSDLPGVGPKLTEKLARYGLKTVPDALPLEAAALRTVLGDATGQWLWERIRGIDPTPVEARGRARSVSREETFARDVGADAELETELMRLSVRVAADLREDGFAARTVTVKLRDADFRTRQAGRTLPEPIESERAVFAVARELLARLRAERRVPARLLGVALSGLQDADRPAQLGLFAADAAEAVETERDRQLARALDRLRGRFGAGAIVPGRIVREDGLRAGTE